MHESERRLLHAQQVARIGSWEWEVAADTVTWSEELFHIYGRDPASFDASFVGYMECVHPDDRDLVQSVVGAALESGETFELDHRVVTPAGAVLTMYCKGDVERDSDGQAVRMSGIAQDVTEARAREDTLARALRRLSEARALARIGNWELDLATGELEWSEELYALYGVDPATFSPTLESLYKLLGPVEAEVLRNHIAHARATGEGWENDVRMAMSDGRVRILHGRAQVEADPDGHPVRIRGTRQDVTDLREREADLREAEERFRLAFDEAPIGLALVAPDGAWLRVNQALCDLVGYSAEQMLGMRTDELTHPDDLAASHDYMRRLLAGETQTAQLQKRYFHADGRVVWIQLNVSLAHDENGDPLYFITHVQDISGRKVTEDKLRASEGRFRRLLESAPDAMVIVSGDGRIVLVNRQAETLFGFGRDELIGEPVEILIPHSFRERHHAHRAGFAAGPQARPMGAGLELFGLRSDGTEFPVEISLSPLETADGLLVSAAIRDITERKKAESIVVSALKRERELTERLRELDGIKNDFVATVSHELRTPLTNIVGSIELLMEGDFGELNPQQIRVVSVLERNSQRLLDLIKDLLDLNQIDSGGLGLHPVPTDVRELVERVKAQMAGGANNQGVQLVVRTGAELGTAVVDGHQLERVLENLMTNAIKFTPEGGTVTVEAGCSGDRVRFVVSDTGIGIPEDEQQYLFTRFYRSSVANQKAIPGTGLGLVIVKSILEEHGGTISVASQLGKGTTVTVELPLRPPVEPPNHRAHATV